MSVKPWLETELWTASDWRSAFGSFPFCIDRRNSIHRKATFRSCLCETTAICVLIDWQRGLRVFLVYHYFLCGCPVLKRYRPRCFSRDRLLLRDLSRCSLYAAYSSFNHVLNHISSFFHDAPSNSAMTALFFLSSCSDRLMIAGFFTALQ